MVLVAETDHFLIKILAKQGHLRGQRNIQNAKLVTEIDCNLITWITSLQIKMNEDDLFDIVQ